VRPLQKLEFRGCRLAYRIDGAGPPVLMIQGVGAYGLGWNPQVAILEKHFACLSFDNRGIGSSQPAGMRLSVDQMAADALALMDAAGWDSAHIVGHSLGGLIALQLALAAKSRVRSLSLLCTFARGAHAMRMTASLLWIVLRIRFAPRRWRREAFMELVLPSGQTKGYPDDIADRLSAVFGHDIADIPPITSQQLAAMRHADVTPRLHELSGIPTLVISGAKDMIARPSSGRAIAEGIPGARYLEIPGASHAFPILEAERCAALLLEHLAEAERSTLQAAPAGPTIGD
jgi:pimeloyl-ACP methyl ester carboxylesterase